MRTFTVSSGDYAARPGLYRAWVPLHNDSRATRVSIWMDPPLTAFGLPQETNANPLAGKEANDAGRFAAEHPTAIRPCGS
jgi:hypothetical protein